jgi:hypothetical protein
MAASSFSCIDEAVRVHPAGETVDALLGLDFDR